MRRFQRLVFALAISLTLLLGAMFGVWFYSESHRVESRLHSELNMLLRSNVVLARQEIEALDDSLRDLRYHIQAEDQSGLSLESYVTELVYRQPKVLDILVLNEKGQLLHSIAFSTWPGVERLPLFTGPRSMTRDGLFIDTIRHSQTFEGAWFFVLSRPLYDRMGHFNGVVAMLVSTDKLTQQFEQMERHADTSLHLLYEDGTVLVQSPLRDAAVGSQVAPELRGAATRLAERTIKGNRWLVGSQRLGNWPLYLQVRVDEGLAYRQFSDLTLWVVGFGLIAVALLWTFLWSILKQHSSLRKASRELKASYEEIHTLHEQLKAQAVRDPLTGLYNRAYLNEMLPRELKAAERDGYQLSVIMIDFDHFKRINDTWGHAVGDEALRAMGGLLDSWVQGCGIAGRLGGEEFIAVLPRMVLEVALPRAESWRVELETTELVVNGQLLRMTASFGVACYPRHGSSLSELYERADQALYQAKRMGRNRVEVYHAESMTSAGPARGRHESSTPEH